MMMSLKLGCRLVKDGTSVTEEPESVAKMEDEWIEQKKPALMEALAALRSRPPFYRPSEPIAPQTSTVISPDGEIQ
jgi:hypothetical protein